MYIQWNLVNTDTVKEKYLLNTNHFEIPNTNSYCYCEIPMNIFYSPLEFILTSNSLHPQTSENWLLSADLDEARVSDDLLGFNHVNQRLLHCDVSYTAHVESIHTVPPFGGGREEERESGQ